VRASNLGRQSHQVIALAATGQLGMAAAGQIRLAVVTRFSTRQGRPSSARWDGHSMAAVCQPVMKRRAAARSCTTADVQGVGPPRGEPGAAAHDSGTGLPDPTAPASADARSSPDSEHDLEPRARRYTTSHGWPLGQGQGRHTRRPGH
jgi:hypothetical protein